MEYSEYFRNCIIKMNQLDKMNLDNLSIDYLDNLLLEVMKLISKTNYYNKIAREQYNYLKNYASGEIKKHLSDSFLFEIVGYALKLKKVIETKLKSIDN